MLEQVLDHIHNYFERAIVHREFVIRDGKLTGADFLHDGQYFRINGSVLNDGVYQYPAYGLIDEAFEGEIWALAIPPAIISLAHEISDWQTKYGESVASPFQSESFGGYSYNKASGSNSGSVGWETIFKSRLNRWRKISSGYESPRERVLSSSMYVNNHISEDEIRSIVKDEIHANALEV